MLRLVLKRFFFLLPVGLGVVILVALLIHAIPGDPVDNLLGPFATAKEKELLRSDLSLDKPWYIQLSRYIIGLTHGDLGTSMVYHLPVSRLILERVIPTAELALAAMIVAILVSFPLGLISALKAGTKTDLTAMLFALVGVAIPNFWLGPLLVWLFSLHWDLLPVSERMGLDSYLLPSITLGTSLAAILTRMLRTSVLESYSEDYVRTARAKGVGEIRVLAIHVLRNAGLPVVTLMGLQFGVLLTGAIITEKIFDWPGLGSLLLEGIGNRDYPLVQGCVLFFSAVYVSVNFLTDLTYGFLDPRIRVDD